MSSKSITGKAFAVVIVIDIALLGVWTYFFFILRSEVKGIETAVARIAELDAKGKGAVALERLLEETKSERGEISSYFIRGEDGTVKLYYTLESLADELGLTLTISGVAVRAAEDPGAPALGLELNLEGTFESISHFINLIELAPFVSDWSDAGIELVSKGGDSHTAVWRAKLSLRISSYVAD